MPDLLALALTHAICNATTEVRPLSETEAKYCLVNWHNLKSQFEPDLQTTEFGDPALRDLHHSAYQKWKAWERDNPEIADDLRQQAELKAAEAVRPAF
ncbi:MAG: hypothetical protein AAFQ79_12295 [Pseudomonadota bacterium]